MWVSVVYDGLFPFSFGYYIILKYCIICVGNGYGRSLNSLSFCA